jgi:hypothetical protein
MPITCMMPERHRKTHHRAQHGDTSDLHLSFSSISGAQVPGGVPFFRRVPVFVEYARHASPTFLRDADPPL